MKVAAYCRVSTELDDQQNSLKSQKEYFEHFIKEREKEAWSFAGIYADEGITGTCMNKREAFRRMLVDAKAGKIDLILTKEVSRFARNTVDALIAIRTLRACGVGVFFIIDHIDTRENDGEIRLTLMASMAQEESRKISERVKWGQKRQMERGVVFGRGLFGYRLEKGALLVEEQEAAVVKGIFYKYVIEEKGTGVIARELNEGGSRTRRGNLWSNVAVKRILSNEKYKGDLIQKKSYTPDYLTHKKKKNDGNEELVIKEKHHTPIVSENMFDAATKRMTDEAVSDEKKYQNRYWCSGKIHCENCGEKYVSRIRKRKNGESTQGWMCSTVVLRGRRACSGRSRKDEELRAGFLVSLGLEQKEWEKANMDELAERYLNQICVGQEQITFFLQDGRKYVCPDKGRYRGTGTS